MISVICLSQKSHKRFESKMHKLSTNFIRLIANKLTSTKVVSSPSLDLGKRCLSSTSNVNLFLFRNCSVLKTHYFTQRNKFIGNQYISIDQTSCYSSHPVSQADKLIPEELSERVYEEIADETLESLYTYFDEAVEKSPIKDCDVSYSTGVLTIKLGKFGTYVINKQTPNRQIWLSSPTSGPKRYDFINKTWIYRHDGVSLYQLLNSEIPQLLSLTDLDFVKDCVYGKAI